MSWPDGYGRRVLDRVESTNAEAARIAHTLSGPEWILALEQSAGRGRRGRPWADPIGNFAATLALPNAGTPQSRALRSFVAALALFDALAEVTGTADGLALKWPNDVLMNGGKVAGILLESLGGANAPLAIGIGVNLINAPTPDLVEAGAMAPVSVWRETGQRVGPEAMLDALAAAFARYEAQFVQFGFAPIRSAWLARATRLGETVTARMMHSSETGIFETLDDQGQLVLKTAKGRVHIAAAEVFF